MAMIRKQLYISAEQQRKLKKLARQWGCSESGVLRAALDRLPEYDDSVYADPALRGLAVAGLLVPPPDDEDLPRSWEEAEALERELDEMARQRGKPLGLAEAVIEDRR